MDKFPRIRSLTMSNIPHYASDDEVQDNENDDYERLKDFVIRLRCCVFASLSQAALYPGIKRSRTTLGRYESGAIRPPVRYWAWLAQVIAAQMLDAHEAEQCRQKLLHEINKILEMPEYRKHKRFQTWEDLCAAGQDADADTDDSSVQAPAKKSGPEATVQTLLSPRYQLRSPVADFVGREEETEQLVMALQTTLRKGCGAVISGVQGMGGIGKTELAYQVAHQLRDVFPDAQIVLHLRGSSTATLTPEQALQTVIRAFKPDAKLPDELQALEQHYRTVLYGQHALILADDAHNAAQVRSLIPPPGSTLLITSRQRFTLPGMMMIDLEQLREDEAVTLLCSICNRLSVSEAQAIAHICSGLPLALRVSSSMLRNDPALSAAEYILRLADEQQRFERLRDPDDPQLDVAASLALSYAQLDEVTQQVFRQLGVMVADFATELAQAVVEVSGDEVIEARLHTLLRRNLIMYDVDRDRWRLHDLVRDLARRELKKADEWEHTMWRYAQAAVQTTEEMETQYLAGGDRMLAALARFDVERPHIDAARVWVTAHAETPDRNTLLMADAVATYNIGVLRYDAQSERLPQLERALAASQQMGDQRRTGAMLNRLGGIYLDLGNAAQAIKYFKQYLAIVQSRGDREGEFAAHTNLGRVWRDLGDIRLAISSYEQSLAITQARGDRRSEGTTRCNLGDAYVALGLAGEALEELELALDIARSVGNRRGERIVLNNLGDACLSLGKIQQAMDYFDQAVVAAQELKDRRGEGIARHGLGRAAVALGNVGQAIEHCKHALIILREVGDRRQEGYALCALGVSYAAQDDHSNAQATFEEALSLFHAIGDRHGEAKSSWYFGLALTQWGDRAQALPLLREAMAYEQKIGHAKAAERIALLIRLEAGEVLSPELHIPPSQRAIGGGLDEPTEDDVQP